MVVIVVCGAMVLVGLWLAARWCGLDVRVPDRDANVEEGWSPARVAQLFLWHLTLGVASGLAAGVLMAGPGGRLAMRLLAVTAGPRAQGRLTEAGATVGRITADGTIGLMIFGGLLSGLVTGLVYVAIRRWLPAGRWGGVTFGLLLLVVGATRLDPLRGSNPDFDIVGPGYVAIAVFVPLVLVHGVLVAALAARLSRALPLISRRPRDWVWYLQLLILLASGLGAPIMLGAGLVVVGLSRSRPLLEALRSPNAMLAGRVVIATVALIALPGFVLAMRDILASFP